MALEALRDALAQAGRDYFNLSRQDKLLEEQRAYEKAVYEQRRDDQNQRQDEVYRRNLADQRADRATEEQYQMSRETRGIQNRLTEIRAMPGAQLEGEAAKYFSPAQIKQGVESGNLVRMMQEKTLELNAAQMLADGKSKIEIEAALAPLREQAEYSTQFKKNLAVFDQARGLAALQAERFKRLAEISNKDDIYAIYNQVTEDLLKGTTQMQLEGAALADARAKAKLPASMSDAEAKRLMALSANPLLADQVSARVKALLPQLQDTNESRALMAAISEGTKEFGALEKRAFDRGIDIRRDPREQDWFAVGAEKEGFDESTLKFDPSKPIDYLGLSAAGKKQPTPDPTNPAFPPPSQLGKSGAGAAPKGAPAAPAAGSTPAPSEKTGSSMSFSPYYAPATAAATVLANKYSPQISAGVAKAAGAARDVTGRGITWLGDRLSRDALQRTAARIGSRGTAALGPAASAGSLGYLGGWALDRAVPKVYDALGVIDTDPVYPKEAPLMSDIYADAATATAEQNPNGVVARGLEYFGGVPRGTFAETPKTDVDRILETWRLVQRSNLPPEQKQARVAALQKELAAVKTGGMAFSAAPGSGYFRPYTD